MQMYPLLAISLFFSGCSDPEPCVPEQIYVKTKAPRLKILYSIKPYEIKDFSVIDDTYYKVNIEQLHMASKASQRRIYNIDFYEKQNIKFNKEFAR